MATPESTALTKHRAAGWFLYGAINPLLASSLSSKGLLLDLFVHILLLFLVLLCNPRGGFSLAVGVHQGFTQFVCVIQFLAGELHPRNPSMPSVLHVHRWEEEALKTMLIWWRELTANCKTYQQMDKDFKNIAKTKVDKILRKWKSLRGSWTCLCEVEKKRDWSKTIWE